MRNECFEMIFKVRETCQNGKERRIKKSVYSPCFKHENGRTIFVPLNERIRKGVEVLEEMNYYDIVYLETKRKTLLFTEWE